ncbi:hypothetical protein SAMN05216266_11868 [Amycolatopsis marina]|uniref:VOC domain-containing protein n=1 Tax=Amycolatopsis marina TaxID=490629 RepID=A0A1I1C1F0_9PSEU|nr:VOC family protein [Amycolatopsis marina]SFB54708.1 hypothetical protein SAMN05216266_11868 [Amycolatopsis marina]
MLRGFSTISLFAEDIQAAKHWYTDLLGLEPYFERPVDGPLAYVEFRVGDYQHELGIIDSRYAPHVPPPAPGGVVLYWHVDDVETTLETLLAKGAREHEALTVREEGFVTASVIDPFGNVLGIMKSPHYLDVLAGFSGREPA